MFAKIAGCLFLLAALLKVYDQYFLVGFTRLDSTIIGFNTALLWYEIILGSALLSGKYYRRVLVLACVTLFVFGCYSFVVASQGQDSCQCFGRLSLNPVLVGCLDWALACLVYRISCPPEKIRIWILQTGLIFCIVISCFSVWQATNLNQLSPGLIKLGNRVVLDHEQWHEKRFPLALMVEENSNETIRTGKHQVLLVKSSCPHCQDIVVELERKNFGGLVVEFPGSDGTRFHKKIKNSELRIVTTRTKFDYIGQFPILLEIKNGIVKSARVPKSSRDILRTLDW